MKTIKSAKDSNTLEIFLKMQPRSNPDDKGTYYFYIEVQQDCTLPYSDPDVDRFDFHLEASTIRRYLTWDWVRRLWSWPSVSERIDNERTPKIAKLELPFLEPEQ